MPKHSRTTKDVFLRLTEQDFSTLRIRASAESLTDQEYLRRLIRYGKLPQIETPQIAQAQ